MEKNKEKKYKNNRSDDKNRGEVALNWMVIDLRRHSFDIKVSESDVNFLWCIPIEKIMTFCVARVQTYSTGKDEKCVSVERQNRDNSIMGSFERNDK